MLRPASRAVRRPLALALAALGALGAVGAVGACTDEPTSSTGPLPPSKPLAAVGDVITVTTINNAGLGSLRSALASATGGEIIRFDPSLAGQTIILDSALVPSHPVTIEGPPGKGITISGGGKDRVFDLRDVESATLRNLTITNGKAEISAAAVYSRGDLVLEHSTVSGNEAPGTSGVTATNLTLINSTITGNKSTATDEYGPRPAVYGASKLVVINSTVAQNSSGGVGSRHSLVLRNSIISSNVEGRGCVAEPDSITYEGRNLSDDRSCGGAADMLSGDPRLGALADNGGPAKTFALLPGSPAINAGADCSVAVDQRYVARDAKCDLGAFEFTDFTSVTLTIDPNAYVNPSNGWATVTGTARCSRGETLGVTVELAQEQRTGRAPAVVRAAATVGIECGATARPWGIVVAPVSGGFQNGSGAATAKTAANTGAWVTPAAVSSLVKLAWGRR